MKNRRLLEAPVLGCAICALGAAPAGAATLTSTSLFAKDATGSQTLVRSQTGAVSTALGTVPASSLGVGAGAGPAGLANATVGRYAPMLGLESAAQLKRVETRSDLFGSTVVYDQVAGDVPVYDGRVLVRVDRSGKAIVSVHASLSTQAGTSAAAPTITADAARTAATALVPDPDVLAGPRLVIYNGVPFGSVAPTLTYVVDVRSESRPMRKIVFVDATSGRVIDAQDRMETAQNRAVYNLNHGTFLFFASLARNEGGRATGDRDVDGAYDGTGATWQYYKNTFGRDSYDNRGAQLKSYVHYGNNYGNAGWDGAQMRYGDGFAVLDVTAHELTHAVTQETADLQYAGQSGALNEALSDMAAWDVDPGDTTIGEDLPIGAIRDMANPGSRNQPATASAYVCTTADNGGVHINSGIPNKVYSNMVESLGRDTAQQVRYKAQTDYLTPQASFADARAAFISAGGSLGRDTAKIQAAWDAQGVTANWAPSC